MRSAVHHVHHLTGSDAPIAVRAVRTPEITPPRALISAQTHTKAMVFLSRPKVNGAGNMRRNTHAPTAASSVSPPQRPMLTTMLWPWSTSDARPANSATVMVTLVLRLRLSGRWVFTSIQMVIRIDSFTFGRFR